MLVVYEWPNLSEYFCHRAIDRSWYRWRSLPPERRGKQRGKSKFSTIVSKGKVHVLKKEQGDDPVNWIDKRRKSCQS